MTAICKLRFSYLGLLRLLPNRFNGPVLAVNGVFGNFDGLDFRYYSRSALV
jgi:hypothetical protein